MGAKLDVERELEICDELHRIVELNDESLDSDLEDARQAFDDSAHLHYPDLLARFRRLRELLGTLISTGHLSDRVYIEDEIYDELRQLLGGGGL